MFDYDEAFGEWYCTNCDASQPKPYEVDFCVECGTSSTSTSQFASPFINIARFYGNEANKTNPKVFDGYSVSELKDMLASANAFSLDVERAIAQKDWSAGL